MTLLSKCKQICVNILSICKHQQKTRDLKLKLFFPVQTTGLHESLEGSDSSLAYSNGELWPYIFINLLPKPSLATFSESNICELLNENSLQGSVQPHLHSGKHVGCNFPAFLIKMRCCSTLVTFFRGRNFDHFLVFVA